MNKKRVIILIIIFVIVISFLTSIFVLFIKPKIVENQNRKITNSTQTQNIKYTANFQIIGENPQELKIILDNPPGNGVAGIKIYLKITPALKSQLKITDIIETLPKPWQYVRKEFTNDNEIVIQTIYLQPGINGDTNKEFSFAKINLPSTSESSEISLDFDKSKLFGKQSGLEISFDNKIYSK